MISSFSFQKRRLVHENFVAYSPVDIPVKDTMVETSQSHINFSLSDQEKTTEIQSIVTEKRIDQELLISNDNMETSFLELTSIQDFESFSVDLGSISCFLEEQLAL